MRVLITTLSLVVCMNPHLSLFLPHKRTFANPPPIDSFTQAQYLKKSRQSRQSWLTGQDACWLPVASKGRTPLQSRAPPTHSNTKTITCHNSYVLSIMRLPLWFPSLIWHMKRVSLLCRPSITVHLEALEGWGMGNKPYRTSLPNFEWQVFAT